MLTDVPDRGEHVAVDDGIWHTSPLAESGNIRYDNSLRPATAYHRDPDRCFCTSGWASPVLRRMAEGLVSGQWERSVHPVCAH